MGMDFEGQVEITNCTLDVRVYIDSIKHNTINYQLVLEF